MSIKESEETSDVLRRAAEVLRSSGRCRYELGPARCDAGPHCALGPSTAWRTGTARPRSMRG